MNSLDWPFLFAQIMTALALIGATSWYAYYTMKLATQQRKSYFLSREIWERKNTPRIWFSLTRPGTSKICLKAVNIGGDVAINVKAIIRTDTESFTWEWPYILPKEHIHIDLPDKLSYVSNLENVENLHIECKYADSRSKNHERTQSMEPKQFEKGVIVHLHSRRIEDIGSTQEVNK